LNQLSAKRPSHAPAPRIAPFFRRETKSSAMPAQPITEVFAWA
jgi:hypothetical protein